MARRGLLLLIVSTLSAALVSVAHAETLTEDDYLKPIDLPYCIDAVVVATVLDMQPEPIPDLGHGVIVMRWPWALDIDVKRVVFGDVHIGRMKIMMSLHTSFREDLRYFVFFLRGPEHGLVATDVEVGIVRDRRGRFVLPLFEPVDEEALVPGSWIPRDYLQRLRPISYAYQHTWREPKLNTDKSARIAQGDSDWISIKNTKPFAARGLMLDEMPALLQERLLLPCR